MVVPVFLALAGRPEHSVHAHMTGNSAGMVLLATAVHAGAYLIVTGAIAVIVYEKFGVNFLRKAWINLDLIWAVALIGTGIANLLI